MRICKLGSTYCVSLLLLALPDGQLAGHAYTLWFCFARIMLYEYTANTMNNVHKSPT